MKNAVDSFSFSANIEDFTVAPYSNEETGGYFEGGADLSKIMGVTFYRAAIDDHCGKWYEDFFCF